MKLLFVVAYGAPLIRNNVPTLAKAGQQTENCFGDSTCVRQSQENKKWAST